MSDARLLDRGYRRYDGARETGRAPIVSLAIHGTQRALGIRRSAPSKILPILTVLMAYLPAAAFVGLAAFLPKDVPFRLPNYEVYFGYITAVIFLFTALVSPELLCPDRRSGLINLYLASPLTPYRYLLAKAAALAGILCLVLLGPPLLLTVAYTLQGVGPDSPGDFAIALVRILGAAVVLIGSYGGVALAISSFTDRRAFASAGIILVLLVPNAVNAILVGPMDFPRWMILVSLTATPFELVERVFGHRGAVPGTPTFAVVLAWLGILTAAAGILIARYRRT